VFSPPIAVMSVYMDRICARPGNHGFNKAQETCCPVVGALVAAARDDQVRVHVDDKVARSRCLTRRRLSHAPVW
jgi:hypothetical protein